MKNLLGAFILILALSSCSNDKNKPAANDDLSGKWTMVTYVAFMPELPVLKPGDVTWQFDLKKNKLLINNQVESAYSYLYPSGSYVISVTADKVTIGETAYKYYFENNQLIVSDRPELDGPIMTFKR